MKDKDNNSIVVKKECRKMHKVGFQLKIVVDSKGFGTKNIIWTFWITKTCQNWESEVHMHTIQCFFYTIVKLKTFIIKSFIITIIIFKINFYN